ncbi:MAG TPA: SRPBCC family protein [Galbitalea sp.]|jgi:hypothetical protein
MSVNDSEGASVSRGFNATTRQVARVTPATAFAIATPLTPVGFYPKSGLLPAVTEVRDQPATWNKPGQTRQLMLSDGGSVIEHITNVEPNDFFAYNLTDFQKLFGRLVDHARAEWTFTAVDAGTEVRWSYTFFPRRGGGVILAAIVKLLWGPYMRRVLPGIVAEVERQGTGRAAGTNPASRMTC